ncbi:hypothetical protein [cf. Phormidesmis sp. LEGE 11477]|uniref:hypothetical protein n=1 Tax=cf. Phormidesmis sp. LEGE 11477 TaxID=1828680 RepID=UPI001880B790|nr:hypothetical protein [cf. Phormidesmis sp. LEGE 11477]MBE9064387.1 hypothetical protein [cf. Phormidesmis sp. LEGE 11477]
MIDQLTVTLAIPIVKVILDKLYEGAGSKLGEKAVELAAVHIQKLGQIVWNRCFKGRPGSDEVLVAAAEGVEPALQQMRDSLLFELEKPDFINMVEPIVQEIHRTIVQVDNTSARNLQQNFGGQGLQVNNPNSQVVQAGDNNTFTFNTYNTQSDD